MAWSTIGTTEQRCPRCGVIIAELGGEEVYYDPQQGRITDSRRLPSVEHEHTEAQCNRAWQDQRDGIVRRK